jgi:hypothetical protein
MNASQTLADRQAAFMAQVLNDEAPLPAGWGDRHAQGMNVYRGNYRSSVIEALKSTYEKTERWVGEAAFQRAAAHHVITNPPSSWTLDDAGAGFDATCAELFRNDPEVAELAWLEWAMLQAFTAENVRPLDAEGFATKSAGFVKRSGPSSELHSCLVQPLDKLIMICAASGTRLVRANSNVPRRAMTHRILCSFGAKANDRPS